MGISNFDIVGLTLTTTANLPTAAAGNEGAIAYDNTTNTIKFSDGSSWANIGVTGAAGTLDSSYDSGGAGAGGTITVDAADIILNLSTGFNLLVNGAAVGTTAAGIQVTDNGGTLTDAILVTSTGIVTDAIDVSSALITNAINIGANAIVGTNFSVTGAGVVTSTGQSDSGTSALTTLTATTGTITTLSATTLNAPTIRSAASGNVNLAVDAAGNGTIGIGATSTGAVTITPATTITGAVTLSSDLTMSSGGLDITAGAGDGDAVDIVNLAANAAIDIDAVAASVAAGGLVDIDVSTGSAPIISLAASGAYTGAFNEINLTNAVGAIGLSMTGAGVRTVSMVSITDTPSTTATFSLNVTPAGAAANANVFDINVAGTGSANVIDIDFAAAYVGDALDINMTNAVGASAIILTGAGTRTEALVAITDVPTTSAPSIDLNITPGAGVQSGIDIDVAGTQAADVISIDCSAAFTGDMINLTTTNMGAAGQALVVDGSIAASGAVVSLSTSGILTAAGSVLTSTASTQPGAANVGTAARFLDTGAAQVTSYAVQISSTNNEALNVSTGKAHFTEAATFLDSNKVKIVQNYVQAGGVNNAITVAANADDTGTAIPLTDGLVLYIDLNTLTLQAGANTLDYIGGGAVAITRATSTAANLTTAFAANGVISLIYSSGASAWLCLTQ